MEEDKSTSLMIKVVAGLVVVVLTIGVAVMVFGKPAASEEAAEVTTEECASPTQDQNPF